MIDSHLRLSTHHNKERHLFTKLGRARLYYHILSFNNSIIEDLIELLSKTMYNYIKYTYIKVKFTIIMHEQLRIDKCC